MLETTLTTTVTEDQIDHLGHMNVLHYARNARSGTANLLDGLAGWDAAGHVLTDVYTRHLREQLLGAPLEVRSGILAVDDTHLTLHHELANTETGDLAAIFRHRLRPTGADGAPVPVSDKARTEAGERVTPPPTHAASRSIDPELDLAVNAPSLELLGDRALASRKPRVIPTAECGPDGIVAIEDLPMLVWGGEPLDDSTRELTLDETDGRNLAWASMESRVRDVSPARAGMRIQPHAALVSVADKVIHSLQWVHDLDSGRLLVVFEVVSLAFDIDARRPASIPDAVRERMQAELHPDLAPAGGNGS